MSPDDSLAEPSALPFGLPPFAGLDPEHCREALLAGMAEQRAEVAAIVGSAADPTFDDTVVALERSGRLLHRARAVSGNLASSVSTPRMREIERGIARGLRRENGDAFRQRLLAVGGSVDPLAAFRAVRGRDADPRALLRRRGLTTAPS